MVATRAQAAVNYQKAADAIANGQYAAAKRAVEDNKALYFEAEKVAGPQAVAQDKADDARMNDWVQAAHAAPQSTRLDSVKQMKLQGLRGFGLSSTSAH